jgi:hypothetical protein
VAVVIRNAFLPDALHHAIALREVSLRLEQQQATGLPAQLWGPDNQDLTDFLDRYFGQVFKLPRDWESLGYLCRLEKRISLHVRGYFQNCLDCLNLITCRHDIEPTMVSGKISDTLSCYERTRLQRAFLRFDLYTKVCVIDNRTSPGPFMSFEDQSTRFIGRMDPWEVEEISCVFQYVSSEIFSQHHIMCNRLISAIRRNPRAYHCHEVHTGDAGWFEWLKEAKISFPEPTHLCQPLGNWETDCLSDKEKHHKYLLKVGEWAFGSSRYWHRVSRDELQAYEERSIDSNGKAASEETRLAEANQAADHESDRKETAQQATGPREEMVYFTEDMPQRGLGNFMNWNQQMFADTSNYLATLGLDYLDTIDSFWNDKDNGTARFLASVQANIPGVLQREFMHRAIHLQGGRFTIMHWRRGCMRTQPLPMIDSEDPAKPNGGWIRYCSLTEWDGSELSNLGNPESFGKNYGRYVPYGGFLASTLLRERGYLFWDAARMQQLKSSLDFAQHHRWCARDPIYRRKNYGYPTSASMVLKDIRLPRRDMDKCLEIYAFPNLPYREF